VYAAYSAFQYCVNLVSANLSSLSGFTGRAETARAMFGACTRLSCVRLDSLNSINVEKVLNYAFTKCESLPELRFPALSGSVGKSGMANMCTNCHSLSVVDFPELTSANTTQFDHAFGDCSALLSVNLPKLKSAGQQAFQNAFNNCVSLETLSFPELTSLGASCFGNATYRAFVGCDSLTSLHFRADAQAVVQACDGYDVNFGAPRGDFQFIYDL
jgi:hypothetical protein